MVVYEGETRVAQVKVDVAFDVISYVIPPKDSADIFKNNYYRAVIE